MDYADSKFLEEYPAYSPAKLRKSLPALGHTVDYYDPIDKITSSQDVGDSLKSTLPATPNSGSRRLLNWSGGKCYIM